MTRVLQLIPSMSAGGIESVVLELLRNLDPKSIQCDVAALNPNDPIHRVAFEGVTGCARFISNAGTHRSLASKVVWRIRALVNFRRMLVQGQYDVLHCHLGRGHTPYTLLAWFHGVGIRIVHAHQAGSIRPLPRLGATYRGVARLLRLDALVTHRVGCGDRATQWIWGGLGRREDGRPFTIYNGIDVSRFERMASARAEVPRSSTNGPRLIHVGRFTELKNQVFLLEILKELLIICPSARMVVVGYGPLEETLRETCDRLGISNAITFLASSTDVAEQLLKSDIFVLPSLYEGLPVAAIEAQVAGVPIVMSDRVTREVDLGRAQFYPLEKGARWWAEAILSVWENPSPAGPLKHVSLDQFDIKRIALEWEEIYLDANHAWSNGGLSSIWRGFRRGGFGPSSARSTQVGAER